MEAICPFKASLWAQIHRNLSSFHTFVFLLDRSPEPQNCVGLANEGVEMQYHWEQCEPGMY